jgi:hypothetical protein
VFGYNKANPKKLIVNFYQCSQIEHQTVQTLPNGAFRHTIFPIRAVENETDLVDTLAWIDVDVSVNTADNIGVRTYYLWNFYVNGSKAVPDFKNRAGCGVLGLP